MDLNYYGLIEMANNIVKTAFSIGVGIVLTIALFGGKAVSRWIFRKQVEKKKKDEESAIENHKHDQSTSFVDAATQTEVQKYPMESVRGLQNLGNTCYFDSTMQALVHTNLVFREKLENLGKKEEFVRNVLKFLSAMQLKTSKPYSPNDLHSMFGKKSPKFADFRQHDSHECLRNFLDNVRKEERDSSGAVDKRKVLTVVDSVFGGHFMTVYICKECETPYHVCEALLDISLPIMIDEKDLAAMNSARGSNRKESRTVKLQTPNTDDTNKSKLIQSPTDKSIAGEDSIKPKPSKTEQDCKLDVALQQNTSEQAFQLKSKTETADRHPTNINAEPLASGHEFEVSSTSHEPEARSVQGNVTPEAEELHNLNDVVNLSPKNVVLENTSDGKIGDMLKENSLPIPRLFDHDNELGTVSLDDNDQKVENSKTALGTETDLEEVCKANKSEEDNKKAKISDEEKESRNESGSETVAENVESSCSSTTAVSNLAAKYDIANDTSLSQGYAHEPSIPVGTEDNKEREYSEWAKSGARDNPTEIQECNEEQKQSSEKEQHKQREEEQNYDDENDNKKGEDDKETDEDKDEEKEQKKEVDGEHHNLKYDQELEEQQGGKEQNKQEQNVEQAQQVHSDENDDKKAENFEKEEEDDDDEQENLKQDLELEAQHGGKHLLNVQPEKQHKGAEEQQTGQAIRNEEIQKEVGEEQRKPEEEGGGEQGKVHVQEHEKNDMEIAPGTSGNNKGDKENEDEDEKGEDGEKKLVEGEAELEYQGRKVVEEEGKDSDEDDDKEVEEEKETEEDDEEQTGQQKQEFGEFEVVEYASETRDSYRETVDKLMTPLSFSSPYLPSDKTAIRKHVTIYDCLMYFTRKEHIHKEYLCNPCYAKHLDNGGEDVLLTSATKQTMIFNPPAILTLHLKRFELKPGGSVKRTDMITYGELLDIAPYCSSMCLRNDPPCQNIWYSLYGVVVHHGSTLKSGHYMAYVKIKDNDAGLKKYLQEKYFDRDLTREQLIEMMQEKQPGETLKQPGGTWYCMNDSWSHKVPVAEVLNQEAYLLFYERMS